jgi:hypothetical protein
VNYAKKSKKGPQATPEQRKEAEKIRGQVRGQEREAARKDKGGKESGRSGMSGQAEMKAGTKLVQIANAGRYDGEQLSEAVRNELRKEGERLIKKARSNRHPG